jgi:hypothetical protein
VNRTASRIALAVLLAGVLAGCGGASPTHEELESKLAAAEAAAAKAEQAQARAETAAAAFTASQVVETEADEDEELADEELYEEGGSDSFDNTIVSRPPPAPPQEAALAADAGPPAGNA